MCTLCNTVLFLREFLSGLAGLAALSMIGRPVLDAVAADSRLPPEMLGVRIPDSDVAVAAAALMQTAAPLFLFNHCLRTFLLGMIDAHKRSLNVDHEVVFVASILHDLALVPQYAGDLKKSFEENGAEFAEALVMKHGFSADRADKVMKAVLLHAGQAGGMGPDIEFVMVGAAQDVFGPTVQQLSDDELAAMERAVLRLGFKMEFVLALRDHVSRSKKPTWTADFASQPPPGFMNNRWSG
jgi:HD domain